MLLQEDQPSRADGVEAPEEERWGFHLELITEADVPELAEITLNAFRDDATTNGCFTRDVNDPVRVEEERRWREQQLLKMLRQPESGQWCIKVVAKFNEQLTSTSKWRDGLVEESSNGLEFTECGRKRIAGYAIWLDSSANCEHESKPTSDGERDPSLNKPSCLDITAYSNVCGIIIRTTSRILRRRKDVWHLEHLATRPKFQKQGVGSMLMRWGVEQANIERCAVYTEASKAGWHLYRKFGLEDIKKMRFKSGGYRIAMLREPIEW